ncbi:integrase [Streptomyces sp. NRRL F-2664]|uniref:integrase n=1 Tax=Streptomyces sp. NRRL F-2664 TaxID=1463842 RepID=UPI00131D3175|nr:integrase [Streptomyces sp. NRRL F-2664]
MGAVARRGPAGTATGAALAGTLAPPAARAVPGPRQELTPAARSAMAKGVPYETRRGYSGDWARFEQWATSTGHCPMPATAETLTEYATWCTLTPRPRTGQPYKPATIDRALAAVAVAHRTTGHTPPDQTGARLVLRGYTDQLKRAKDPCGRVRKAAAATPRVLRRLVAATDTTTVRGLRDTVALTTGFALAARSSEAALLSWEDITEADDDQGLLYDLYRPKVTGDQPLGVPYGSYPSTCPVRALQAYREALLDRGHTPTGPLLVRIDRHDRINPPMHRHGEPIGDPTGRMTPEGVAEIVTRAAARAGLTGRPDHVLPDGTARWTGHALRRGYAEATRHAKKDPLEAARHGGWADGSRAFAGYHDRAGAFDEELNPLYGIGL